MGVVLAGLIAVNVYVFFFNRGTAPRDVLNLQSTSKGLDGSRKEAIAQEGRAAAPAQVMRAQEAPSPSPASPPLPLAAEGSAPAPSPPRFRVPFAPPPEGAAVRVQPKGVYQVPWAPPPEEEEGDDAPVDKKFGSADTLGKVLAREGFGAAAPAVIGAVEKVFDPKTIQGGQKYSVRLDDEGAPEAFEYQASAVLRFVAERAEDGTWSVRKIEQPVEVQVLKVGGVVDSSLYESVQKAGEASALVSLLVELFAWDVNFYTDTHPGDHWKVIVEKQLLGGRYYKYGRVLAAEYGGKVGIFRSFYFQPGKAKSGGGALPGRYYDERGQAVSKTMLKTPLRYARISSRFDRKRFHPILHVERAHLGIDYAAPVGTPVWASASGRVVEIGPRRGSGNTIVMAHPNGLTTRYYHLSRYARGLRVGQTVKQKVVIGYVGSTGLSTGPHLHFSVTKNGAFVDPNKLQISREAPVADRAAFLESMRPQLAALKSIQPGAVAGN